MKQTLGKGVCLIEVSLYDRGTTNSNPKLKQSSNDLTKAYGL